ALSLHPIQLLKNEAEEDRGENARLSSFIGAIAIGDLVKSTLGPKGMDKIIQSSGMDGRGIGDIQITNDGATILKSIGVDNPAAKVLVDIAKTQDNEVGDGTTSVCVLACELLKEGEKLIHQKIHPQIIVSGWRKATDEARRVLKESAIDNRNDKTKFNKDLMNIARTTLSSKNLAQHKDFFAKLAVSAAMRLKGKEDLKAIQIIKKLGGNLIDSYLDDGFILDKKIGLNQPKKITKAKILLANTPMDTDKVKVFGSRIRVDSMAKVAELEGAEKLKMKEKVQNILQYGENVFINRQLIYNYPEQLFADAGVMAIEHADFDGIERLALVTGGEILSTFNAEPGQVKLGHCELIEEIMIGEDKMIKFSGTPNAEACTIVLRAATTHILDEAERALHDALCVLSQALSTINPTNLDKGGKKGAQSTHGVVCGGGASEMLMAVAVNKLAQSTPGKEALAMESFANALIQLPTIISDNAGLDTADLIPKLRACHFKGQHKMGLNVLTGDLGDMNSLGVTEPFIVKLQILLSASEAAEMIMRVDDVIKQAPRKRVPDRHPC
ncbi:unnamed protein product, partial [Gordionus sp. m RMFG-2023]